MKNPYKEHRSAEQWSYVAARAMSGLTIIDVANACCVHPKTIYRFERGQYKIETDKLKTIKQFYNNLNKGD